MHMTLDVALSPEALPEARKGTVCAVIDVLRATTTIVTALASGAAEVRPFRTARGARLASRALDRQSYLLGGEENGLRIRGFDLGNSPQEYRDPGVVSGKTILFATTNGTPAIRRAFELSSVPVYMAALVNLSSVSAAMAAEVYRIPSSASAEDHGPSATGASHPHPTLSHQGEERPNRILLMCSGREGRLALEDVFCAGLMAEALKARLGRPGIAIGLGDSALVAGAFAAANTGRALEVLRSGGHGRYLQSIGFGKDLEFASRVDLYQTVPAFDGVRISARTR